MTYIEIAEDLGKKAPDHYFRRKICGTLFKRRSLEDLITHYKCSEDDMIKALIKGNFSAYFCPDILKIVFHKVYQDTPTKYFFDIEDIPEGANFDHEKGGYAHGIRTRNQIENEDNKFQGKYSAPEIVELYKKNEAEML